MTWMPDTCICIIEIVLRSGVFVFVDWSRKCEIHKQFNNAVLLQEITTHNSGYNTRNGETPTEAQVQAIHDDKMAEEVRIRGLGAGETK